MAKRRPRTKAAKKRLTSWMMRNFRRYFPNGPHPLTYQEADTRIARGQIRDVPIHPSTGGSISTYKGRPAQKLRTCQACHGQFWQYAGKETYKFCSTRCRTAARYSVELIIYENWEDFELWTTELALNLYINDERRPRPARLANAVYRNPVSIMSSDLAKQLSAKTPLDSVGQADLRKRISTVVNRQVGSAANQLSGRKDIAKWDANQVRLFLGLLNKVVPDMTVNMALQLSETHNYTHKQISEMSNEELEEWLRNNPAQNTPAKDITPDDSSS